MVTQPDPFSYKQEDLDPNDPEVEICAVDPMKLAKSDVAFQVGVRSIVGEIFLQVSKP